MLTLTEIKKQHNTLYNSLHQLLRSDENELSTYLNQVIIKDKIGETCTYAHCYFITLDGNKRPRVKDFAKFIATRISDFAIPRKEVLRALNEAITKNSSAPTDALNLKARKLFTKLPESGEGGELILSILAETYLKLPQLFTKMVLKTNSDMHVHGSDGIHAGINSDGHLAIYWGESKIYADVTTAVRKCFSSLAPYLLDSGGSDSTNERDLQLMRDYIEFDDTNLENALKSYLDPNNSFFNKLEYRGLCLVGFDSYKYPTQPNTKTTEILKNEIQQIFNERKVHIENRIFKEKINTFSIELFLLPFPNVDEFRLAFRKELGLNNE